MVAGQRHQAGPERLLGTEPRRQSLGRRLDRTVGRQERDGR